MPRNLLPLQEAEVRMYTWCDWETFDQWLHLVVKSKMPGERRPWHLRRLLCPGWQDLDHRSASDWNPPLTTMCVLRCRHRLMALLVPLDNFNHCSLCSQGAMP